MTNGQINQKFLNATDAATKNSILSEIAKHYGITAADALDEITSDESEHLLDYLTGSTRTAAHLLMRRHGLSA